MSWDQRQRLADGQLDTGGLEILLSVYKTGEQEIEDSVVSRYFTEGQFNPKGLSQTYTEISHQQKEKPDHCRPLNYYRRISER